MHCSPNKGRADQYYRMGQRNSRPNRFRQLWRQLFPAQHRGRARVHLDAEHQQCTKLCPELPAHGLWHFTDTGASNWPGTRRMFNPGSQSQVGSQGSSHRRTPKLVLLLLRFPHESLLLKRSCPTQWLLQKGWLFLQGLPPALFDHLSLYLLYWPDCKEAGNVTPRWTELARAWTGICKQPMASSFSESSLSGQCVNLALFLYAHIFRSPHKQNKTAQEKRLVTCQPLFRKWELLWNSASNGEAPQAFVLPCAGAARVLHSHVGSLFIKVSFWLAQHGGHISAGFIFTWAVARERRYFINQAMCWGPRPRSECYAVCPWSSPPWGLGHMHESLRDPPPVPSQAANSLLH